jgi:UDP-glucuronate decarboxylase
MKDYFILENNFIIKDDLKIVLENNFPWEELKEKTILISGGSGFLASFFAKVFLEAGRKYELNLSLVLVIRNKNSSLARLKDYLGLDNLIIYYHDISLPFSDSFPSADFYIHAASQASPKYYFSDPVGTLKANSLGTSFLLDSAVRSNAKKFLFLSGGETYGVVGEDTKDVDEHGYGYLDPMQIRSCYAESKRIGENMCASWTHQYSLNTSVARLFHTFGPGMALDDGRVFSDFVSDVVNKQNIKLKSDGQAMRTFCYISEAIEGLLTLLFYGNPGEAYNVANPKNEVTIGRLAEILCSLYPEKNLSVSKQTSHSEKYLQTKIIKTTPNISKISQLGWNPSVSIQEGFKRTIESYEI